MITLLRSCSRSPWALSPYVCSTSRQSGCQLCIMTAEVRNGAAPVDLKTALGQDVAAHMYTLPRIWAKACLLLFPLLLVLWISYTCGFGGESRVQCFVTAWVWHAQQSGFGALRPLLLASPSPVWLSRPVQLWATVEIRLFCKGGRLRPELSCSCHALQAACVALQD